MVKTLPNGITAVVLESHAAPVAAVQAWVKVGAADERPDEAGLAHLHEHMLFKGTARRGTGEIAREVESCGGEINAWTSHDQTVYHVVLAADFLSTGLDVLSDAIRSSAFDAEELGRETKVVVEEIKRTEDSPQRRLSREMFASAYSAHPYRLPVIGTPESVLGFTRPKILDFYKRHYTPSNVVVVAVGDFTTADALAEIERWFGDWRADGKPSGKRTLEPAQAVARARVLRGGFRDTRLAVAFHIPDLLHPDVAAIDLLGMLLGQGESSRLQRELKRGSRLFQEIHAYGYTPSDAGLFVAGGAPTQGRELEAIDALLSELGRARVERFSAEELARAKHLIDSEQIYQRESVQGLARKVGFYQTVTGSLEAEAEYLNRVQSATLDDVLGVAERYLNGSNATLVALEADGAAAPLSEEPLRAQLERVLPAIKARRTGVTTVVPQARPSTQMRDSAATPLRMFALSNGGKLLVKREPEVPVVALRAALLGGVRGETAADNGLSALLSRTLTRGAGGRSADAIATAVDGMAGALGGAAGRNSFGLRAETLSRHLGVGLPLFLDCLLQPDFPKADVDRERAQLLQEIHAREDNPSGVCFELFHKTLFTKHPYRLAAGGERESVERLSEEVLRDEWRRRYPLSGLTLAVVGDVDPEAIRETVEARLAKTTSAVFNAPPIVAEARPTSPRSTWLDLRKAQTHMLVGFLGASFYQATERHALAVLSSALSGQGGRLFLELRDKASLAYSVSSLAIEGIEPGYFAVYIGTSPEKRVQALAAMRTELTKVREGRLSEDEMARAQRALIGGHAIGLQRRAAVAGTLALDELYGLGAEAYLHYAERIRAVTAEQVLSVAQRILDPSGEVVAEVGPRS